MQIGDTVLYNPKTEDYLARGVPRAAVITEVVEPSTMQGQVDLTVFLSPDRDGRTSLQVKDVRFDPSGAPGTWRSR